MLEYKKNNETTILQFDKFFICHEWDGSEDYVGFTIPVGHPQAMDLIPRMQLLDTETGETYRIHSVDQGAQTINVKARIDLEGLQNELIRSITVNPLTPGAVFDAVVPDGWTVIDRTGITARHGGTFDMMTRLEVMKKLLALWSGVTMRISTKNKEITLRYPEGEDAGMAFFMDEVNMVKRPQRKSKTSTFFTRLYAQGKDGLTFSDINDGKDYVEDLTYSGEMICESWIDERYTDPQSLLSAAQAKLKAASQPVESYEVAVVDLAKLKPQDFSYMAVDVCDKVRVTDRATMTEAHHVVARYTFYPFYPSLNVIALSTTPGKISTEQRLTAEALSNYNSDFNEAQRAVVERITEQMKATDVMDANVIFHTNQDGKIYELIIIDTDSLETAREVWLWNKAGLAHSSTGYAGTYDTAITADGKIVADFIKAGTLRAITIDGVTIKGSLIQGSELRFGGDGTWGSLVGVQSIPPGETQAINGVRLTSDYTVVHGGESLRLETDNSNTTFINMKDGGNILINNDGHSIMLRTASSAYISMGTNKIEMAAPGGVWAGGYRIDHA